MLDIEPNFPKKCGFEFGKILVKPGQTVSLARDFDPDYTGDYKDKVEGEGILRSKALCLKYPKPTKEQFGELEKAKQELLKEN
jgi:hypothetical protein